MRSNRVLLLLLCGAVLATSGSLHLPARAVLGVADAGIPAVPVPALHDAASSEPTSLHWFQTVPPSLWWSLPIALAAFVASKAWLWGVSLGNLAGGMLRPLRALLLAPVAPLFSRIADHELMHNPVRRKVAAYVQDNPGATIMEVRTALDIAWGTAVYHLERLERTGDLVGDRRGNHHRYYTANTPEARLRAGWSTLQQPTAYSLARAIADNPGIHQKGLCEGLGMNNPAASKHLRRLRDAGLVEAQRVSRFVLYEPTDRLHSTLELMDAQDGAPAHDPGAPDAHDPIHAPVPGPDAA